MASPISMAFENRPSEVSSGVLLVSTTSTRLVSPWLILTVSTGNTCLPAHDTKCVAAKGNQASSCDSLTVMRTYPVVKRECKHLGILQAYQYSYSIKGERKAERRDKWGAAPCLRPVLLSPTSPLFSTYPSFPLHSSLREGVKEER